MSIWGQAFSKRHWGPWREAEAQDPRQGARYRAGLGGGGGLPWRPRAVASPRRGAYCPWTWTWRPHACPWAFVGPGPALGQHTQACRCAPSMSTEELGWDAGDMGARGRTGTRTWTACSLRVRTVMDTLVGAETARVMLAPGASPRPAPSPALRPTPRVLLVSGHPVNTRAPPDGPRPPLHTPGPSQGPLTGFLASTWPPWSIQWPSPWQTWAAPLPNARPHWAGPHAGCSRCPGTPSIAHRGAWETPTHTQPAPRGVPILERRSKVVKRPLNCAEGGGHWPSDWLTLFLGSSRAPVSLCPGVPWGLCVGGGGPPSAGDTRWAGSQARQQGGPSTALGGQGQGVAGRCLGLSGASVSPSTAGGGLDVGCPGWGHPRPGSFWRREFALPSQPVGVSGGAWQRGQPRARARRG